MVTEFGLAYLTGGTILFFFWVYGIVSFVRDLRDTYFPAISQFVTARREQRERTEQENEREERESQLY